MQSVNIQKLILITKNVKEFDWKVMKTTQFFGVLVTIIFSLRCEMCFEWLNDIVLNDFK